LGFGLGLWRHSCLVSVRGGVGVRVRVGVWVWVMATLVPG
jgi:hypothetical protein